MKYYYDLHIHSCLSPCGDNEMTPNNIAGMSKLNGIDIAALTDHNSVLNCPAFFTACERYGVVPVAGMELTTAEDIHVLCLFEELESALAFGEEVNKKRVLIPNRTDIFGEQLILDGEDEICGTEENLLPNATLITYDEAPELVKAFGGVCWPAHIDRDANGVIAALGTVPEEPEFRFVEFNRKENEQNYRALYPELEGKRVIVSSDAHYLENLREKENSFDLPEGSPAEIRRALFGYLKGETK